MRHLIIHDIFVNEEEINVGATDSFRWEWDKGDPNSKTHVWVTITENKGRSAPTEEVGLFAGRTEDIYELALSGIAELSEIAWEIKKQGHDRKKAQELYFGYALTQREIYQSTKHLVVNSIFVDDSFVQIFATDNERWDYERSMADSGANAASHICVSLKDSGKPWVIMPKIELFTSDERALAIAGIGKLLGIAWDIKEKGLDRLQAKEGYFGYAIH
jgi:hypothetical protein